jgi:hypothetical protein
MSASVRSDIPPAQDAMFYEVATAPDAMFYEVATAPDAMFYEVATAPDAMFYEVSGQHKTSLLADPTRAFAAARREQ